MYTGGHCCVLQLHGCDVKCYYAFSAFHRIFFKKLEAKFRPFLASAFIYN